MIKQPRWQDLPKDSLESIYNPRATGPHVAASIALRNEQSAAARAMLADSAVTTADLRYGDGPKETLDLYQPGTPATNPAALAIFVHGGYWRGGDKHECALVVPPLLSTGAVVANINYDLCPDVSLDTIVQQVIRAVRYCHAHASAWNANPYHVMLLGISAGAHLAARVMNAPADKQGLPADLVQQVVAISGIYEPEVITQITVNDQAQIELETAQRNNCLVHPPKGQARYLVLAGGDEPAGWIAQSQLYAGVVEAAGFGCEFMIVNGTNHFSVMSESFAERSEAFSTICNMLDC